jgi:UDP-GlcNAc:undecaprenyl-phosphate GlcNAc-1-phosphate transferase
MELLVVPGTLLIAAVAAWLLTPAAGWVAARLGAVDAPGPRRVHRRPIARMGGLAIAAAIALTVSPAVLPVVGGWPSWLRFDFLAAACALIVVTGIVDDVCGISARLKFLPQIAAAVLAWMAGLQIQTLSLPYLEGIDLGWLGPVLTVLWIVGVTNAVNLIDGLDGLAAGLSAIAALGLAVLFLQQNHPALALVAFAVAGACLGFLRHNFHPARIFMGDTGSLLLGFLLATMAIAGSQKRSAATVLALPILMLAVPIVDTLACFARRMVHGKSPFSGDLGHVHHLLLSLGWSQRTVALALYLVSAALAFGAVQLSRRRDEVFLTAVLAAALLLALVFYGRYRLFSLRNLVSGRRMARILTRLEDRIGAARDVDSAAAMLWHAARVLQFSRLSVYAVRETPPGAAAAADDPPGLELFSVGAPAEAHRERRFAAAGRRLQVVIADDTAHDPSELYGRQLQLLPLLQRLAERLPPAPSPAATVSELSSPTVTVPELSSPAVTVPAVTAPVIRPDSAARRLLRSTVGAS